MISPSTQWVKMGCPFSYDPFPNCSGVHTSSFTNNGYKNEVKIKPNFACWTLFFASDELDTDSN